LNFQEKLLGDQEYWIGENPQGVDSPREGGVVSSKNLRKTLLSPLLSNAGFVGNFRGDLNAYSRTLNILKGLAEGKKTPKKT